MSSLFNQVTVLGAGALGAQISFQIAYLDFEVTTYDVSDAALKQARQRFEGIAAVYPTEVEGATAAAARETIERIRFTPARIGRAGCRPGDRGGAGEPRAKAAVFAHCHISATDGGLRDELVNPTSERVDGFDWSPGPFSGAALRHRIWVNNMAEVMSSPNTDPRVYQRVLAFAKGFQGRSG
jgi:3-hydroxyacyl-CoA dehydrogenase, NAD binding domain